jgi:branched-subunit amino acid transport protein
MAALWFNFAMLVSISLSWLKGKHLLAVILGGLFGPVAYWGGEKLGAITVADTFWTGYFPLALLWALVLPFLVHTHNRLTNRN